MKMKKDVLLIHPSSNYKASSFPTGLFYLASFLSQECEDSDISIVNLPSQIGIPLTEEGLSIYEEKTISLLESKNFDFVGISCWTSILHLSSIHLARIIKAINIYHGL